MDYAITNNAFLRSLSAVSLFVAITVLLLLTTVSIDCHAESFNLVRTVDGSQNPNPPDYVTFQNVQYLNGKRVFPAASNPIITANNIYGTDFIRITEGGQPKWRNYHFGWQVPGQVNDRIYLRTSDDLDPAGPWTSTQLLISEGEYTHVGDPTVWVDEMDQYHMMYTAYGDNGNGEIVDWINYSTSPDGLTWTPNAGSRSTEVSITDPENIAAGSIKQLARPSLVKDGSVWRMWFDMRTDDNGVARHHSYYAESTSVTPTDFTLVHRYANNGGLPGFLEPDVEILSDGSFVAVFQRNFNELFMATSTEGIHFELEQGAIFDADSPAHPDTHIHNPGLLFDRQDDNVYGVAFGMTSSPQLLWNQIGFAYTQYPIAIRSFGSTLHTEANSTLMTEQRVLTSGYQSFDTVVITDPISGEIIHQQDFSGAHPGDVWELQIVTPTTTVPEPMSIVPIALAGIIALYRRPSRPMKP